MSASTEKAPGSFTPGGAWPDIPYDAWAESCTALHLQSQIVGKYRLAVTPWVNHSWHATLYVVPRGLTTGPIHDNGRQIALTFDFLGGKLVGENADGATASFPLQARSVADFYGETRELIGSLGGTPNIHPRPNEIPDPIRFDEDTDERPFDLDAVRRFHRAMISVDRVFNRFRTGYLGKVSPVHLFWGSFDLAVTRFSGRSAPRHPGGIPALPDTVTREAYSHEVSSAGFWPGNGGMGKPMFYSYAYPTPDEMSARPVTPDGAYYDSELGEFLLPYDVVRAADDPDTALLAFLQSTYDAAADIGSWPREALDCPIGASGVPRQVP